MVDRAGAADVMLEVLVVFGDEARILPRLIVGGGQLLQRANQGFGDEPAAKLAKVASSIRIGVKVTDGLGRHGNPLQQCVIREASL